MKIFLDKEVIGSTFSLVYDLDTKLFEKADACDDSWFSLSEDRVNSINDLIYMKSGSIELTPSDVSRSCYDEMSKWLHIKDNDKNVKWRSFMKKDDHNLWMQDLIKKITLNIDETSLSYFKDDFIPNKKFLSSLSQANINREKYDEHMFSESSESVRTSLKSFRPNDEGLTKKITYSLASSSTGRLVVKTGPMILTLPKRCRDILKSKYNNSLLMIDFASFEAKICAFVVGKDLPGDAYQMFMDTVPGIKREVWKTIMLSRLYGSSTISIANDTALDVETVKKCSKEIDTFFEKNSMIESLKRQKSETGFIRNFFGRPIRVSDVEDYALYSYFIQSTGVDISLKFFNQFSQKMSQEFDPVFVIHDALVIDLHNSASSERILSAMDAFASTFMDGIFQLKLKELSC